MTETWLDDSFSDALLCGGTNYSVFRHDRGSRGGGVCIFVYSSIQCLALNLEPCYSELELICIDVFLTGLRFRLLCSYRSPSLDVIGQIRYVELLGKCVSGLCSVQFPIVFVGDFNLPQISWSQLTYPNDRLHVAFLEFINQCGFRQLVSSATRGQNILDLVFTTECSIIYELSVIEGFSTSDHNCVEFRALGQSKNSNKVTVKNFRAANYLAINGYLCSVDWTSLFYNCCTVQEIWDAFSVVVKYAVDNFVPTHEIKIGKINYPLYIRRLQSRKRILWQKRFRLGGCTAYRNCAARCKSEIEKYRRRREHRILLSGNLSDFYKYVNSRVSARASIGPIKRADNTLALLDSEKVEILNRYFGTVFSVDNGDVQNFPYRTVDRLSEITFTYDNVCDALLKLSNSVALGPDGLPAYFLKNVAYTIAQPLAYIFEVSFSLGCLPNVWSKANVCPILKKGNPTDASNHRPVSLTTVCCKVMESIVRDSMMAFFRSRNLLTQHQHGFLARKSTCTQLIECIDMWTLSLQNSRSLDVVYLDFQKAFDKVPHTKLLLKLQSYGISGKLLGWLSAFLRNRTQRVFLNSCYSSYVPVLSGVPQGSVLGPLLFLVYINDIVDNIVGVHIRIFADDVKLFSEYLIGGDQASLHLCLKLIEQWSIVWQMPISSGKCSVLHIGRQPPITTYSIFGEELQFVSTVRDLGVTVSSSLIFQDHCEQIASKAYRRTNLLFRAFTIRDYKILVRAYVTYIRPLLEFNSPVWSPYHVRDVTKVENVQRYVTRRIFFSCGLGDVTYEERLRFLKLDSLQVRRLRTDLIFCFKIIRGFVDIPAGSIFTFSTTTQTRGHQFKLVPLYSQLNVRFHSFANRVVNAWNNLPSHVVSATTVSAFRAKLLNVNLVTG